MQDDFSSLVAPLDGLSLPEWKSRIADIAEEHGMFQELGDRHFASFIDHGNTLLVTFESVESIHTLSKDAHPLGFQMVTEHGWSHLCFVSDGDTWFRDSRVYGFFDQLIDDGFFEDFDTVVFYGAGPCGYAASAFSVAAPGARVLAVQPQATLDPRMTEWDDRFTEMRRVDFNDRYGYAPDMLDAAERAFVLYDPYEDLDAMHAALFERPNVERFRMPLMGAALQTRLTAMQILFPMLLQLADDSLTRISFAKLYRARRHNLSYLRGLMGYLDSQGRPMLTYLLCRNVVNRKSAPRFKRRLAGLKKRAAEGAFRIPEAA